MNRSEGENHYRTALYIFFLKAQPLAVNYNLTSVCMKDISREEMAMQYHTAAGVPVSQVTRTSEWGK